MQGLELAPRDVNRDSANERHGREKGPEVPNRKVRGDEPRDQHAESDQSSGRPSPNEIRSQLNPIVHDGQAVSGGRERPPEPDCRSQPVAAQNPASSARPGRTNGRNRWFKRRAHSAGERRVVKLRLEEITTTRLTDSSDKASVCSAGPTAGHVARREGSGLCDLSVISGPKIGIARVASTEF